MVDLHLQYLNLKTELDSAIQHCLQNAQFIGGNTVTAFEDSLSNHTGVNNVITCGNGTDALQLAIMALDLPKGSKIIVPAFTYIAPVEVIRFLGYEPVFADVDYQTFNITADSIQSVYTPDVKAIVVVHLFGQLCAIDSIATFAKDNKIALIEDYAQSLGAEKTISRDSIITTSFFPTKNLGAYGDGGAVLCNDNSIAQKIRKLANHGQSEKYLHELVGINSRLDALQAAILQVKLPYLNQYNTQRRKNATFYHTNLSAIDGIELPDVTAEHIFHQFTVKIKDNRRDELKDYLLTNGIQTIINYPLPVYKQAAYFQSDFMLPLSEQLCAEVLSLPVYPEITEAQLSYICKHIRAFFNT